MKATIEEIEVSGRKARFDGKYWIDGDGIKHRYVDPMNDEGFKLLFGSEGNEDLLKELLNRIIPGVDIVDLRYNNVEHQGLVQGDGKAIFDVYCEDSEGVRFLVEMQNWSQRHFNKRAVFYSTYAIQDQAAKERKHQIKTLGKDRWDYNYAPVYVVCFLSFDMRRPPRELEKIKQEDRYLSLYKYKEIETEEELGDGTTLVFVEMLKFRKGLSDCRTSREQWLHSMKNMSIQLEVPEEITDPHLREVYGKAEIAAMPHDKRITYISQVMSRNDELNSRAEMLEEALAEGRVKGIAEGREIGLEIGREEGLEEGRREGLEIGREEGLEEGRKEGLEKGREEGLEEGRREGLEKGREEGLEEGRKEGLEKGREEGLEEGRKQGLEKSREEEKMVMAGKLKRLGVDMQTIVQATGLEADLIAGL